MEVKNDDILFAYALSFNSSQGLDFYFILLHLKLAYFFKQGSYLWRLHVFPLCCDLPSRLLSKDSTKSGNTLEGDTVINVSKSVVCLPHLNKQLEKQDRLPLPHKATSFYRKFKRSNLNHAAQERGPSLNFTNSRQTIHLNE